MIDIIDRRQVMVRVLALTFALLAFAVGTAPSAATAKDRLVIGMTQFPSTLNPLIDSMLAKSYVLGMSQRQLTVDGLDWRPMCLSCTELPTFENGRAERVTVTGEDGAPKTGVRKTYTLKEGLHWADGTPVTTADARFAWEVGRHPEAGATTQKQFEDLITFEVIDDRTFAVTDRDLDYKYESLGDFPLLPAHVEAAAFAEPAEYRNRTRYKTEPTNPGLWNGPYMVTEVSEGAYIVLARNPHWTGPAPAFEEIVVRTIEKTAALEANLLSGEIDYVAGELGLTIDQAIAFEERHGDKWDITFKPGLIYEHIDVNLANPILADVRVRRALLHATDREAINQKLFAGKQPVAHGKVHPLDWIHTEDLPTYPFDPDKAAALLDEAGWTEMKGGIRHNAAGDKLSVEIMTTAGNRVRELVEQVLQSYWKRVGVELRIRNEPARVLFGETISKRKFSGLAMFAWLSAPEHSAKLVFHSESIPTEANGWAGQNYTGYAVPEVDALIERIDEELDRDERRALWVELQQRLAEDLPVLPLYFRAEPYIVPKWLKGIEPTGHKYTTTLWIENWRVEE